MRGPPIEIVAYDPAWPERFRAESARIRDALGPAALRIDPVGSTAVPGLAAKPVIDIQIPVARLHPLAPWVGALEAPGYCHVPHPDDVIYPPLHRPARLEARTHVRGVRVVRWERVQQPGAKARMPYRYRIDSSLGVAFFEGWGAFTVADLFDSVRDLVADPDWKPGMVALCDARRMDRFEGDSGDVQRRTALDRSLRERIEGSRCALVTASEEVYGMLRLYEGFSESWDEEAPPAQIGVFRDLARARHWLGLPPEDPTG